jgi:hypothetical protein
MMIIAPAEFTVLSSTLGNRLPDNGDIYRARECVGEPVGDGGYYNKIDKWYGRYVFGNEN